MSDRHWTDEFEQRVLETTDGKWCSKSALTVASVCMDRLSYEADAQLDFVGLLIDEIDALRQRIETLDALLREIFDDLQGDLIPVCSGSLTLWR